MESTQDYNQNKIQENYDVIVVGSGMGGLSAAALLAKTGKQALHKGQATLLEFYYRTIRVWILFLHFCKLQDFQT